MDQGKTRDSFLRILIKRDREKPFLIRIVQWVFLVAAVFVWFYIPPGTTDKYFFQNILFVILFMTFLAIFLCFIIFSQRSLIIAKCFSIAFFIETIYLVQWFLFNLYLQSVFGVTVNAMSEQKIVASLQLLHKVGFDRFAVLLEGIAVVATLEILLFMVPAILTYILVIHAQRIQKSQSRQ